ncbi:MAG: hypothetical protein LBI26_00605 [Holosporales bacterium]|jgi:hypothetical protein|nr:hypothetical protein [Holosporales bacterium]
MKLLAISVVCLSSLYIRCISSEIENPIIQDKEDHVIISPHFRFGPEFKKEVDELMKKIKTQQQSQQHGDKQDPTDKIKETDKIEDVF